MQRNGGSWRLDMDILLPPSADGGRSASNHHMNQECISVIDAASEIGLDKRNVFKILKRLGIETFLERSSSPNHRGQAIAHISLEDFESLRNDMASKVTTPLAADSDTADLEYVPIEAGNFYVIQLEPEHDCGRFKVGFAVSIAERLRSHRCAAPFAKLVKSWPCRRVWERTAIDCVTAGCEQLHTEVFRTSELAGVITRCDQFFSMMPQGIRDRQGNEEADAEQSGEPELPITPI